MDIDTIAGLNRGFDTKSPFMEGGGFEVKRLTCMFLRGTTIRVASRLPRSVWTSGYRQQSLMTLFPQKKGYKMESLNATFSSSVVTNQLRVLGEH